EAFPRRFPTVFAACRAAGVKLTVGHVVRYFPEYALARQKVADGEIGRPAVIRLRRGTFQPRNATDNWFLDPAKSGGLMLDLMFHDFDYARWVAGEVKTVYARNVRAGRTNAPVDHGLAILTHQSGALTHVEGSWAYPPPLFRTQLEIAGNNGWLRYDSGEMAALSLYQHRSSEDTPDVPQPGSPLSESPYTMQIKSFYNYLTGGAPPRVTAADGLAALQIALAAIESAASGEPVRLESLPEVAL
ncbi:MAG TPA: Gfo/Idh/MocA family oxidoreductase, partial [Promineifilum sp.]|nr:Gfo/Idh/MocA family oxidoreductase [Promineifilum sp.]